MNKNVFAVTMTPIVIEPRKLNYIINMKYNGLIYDDNNNSEKFNGIIVDQFMYNPLLPQNVLLLQHYNIKFDEFVCIKIDNDDNKKYYIKFDDFINNSTNTYPVDLK